VRVPGHTKSNGLKLISILGCRERYKLLTHPCLRQTMGILLAPGIRILRNDTGDILRITFFAEVTCRPADRDSPVIS